MHRFWNTQPVDSDVPFGQNQDINPFWNTQLLPRDQEEGQIAFFELEKMKKEPFSLPQGFFWRQFDIADNEKDLELVLKFLHDFYSSDTSGRFRLRYPAETLRWILCTSDHRKEFHIGVMKGEELIGMITGTPGSYIIGKLSPVLVSISFLCIKTGYRGKNLAPILIREITRRITLIGITAGWQGAIHTSSLDLPHVVSRAVYYHRPLNVKKLLNVGFCHRHGKLTAKGTIKYYQFRQEMVNTNLRPMEEKDVPEVLQFLTNHLNNFVMKNSFSEKEFRYIFFPRKDVVQTYVLFEKGKIVGFASYYLNEMSVSDSSQIIKTAYLIYLIEPPGSNLMDDILIIANNSGIDLFTCTNIMKNSDFLQRCKFSKGSGKANYYFYNWKCEKIEPSEMAIVLF